MNVKDRKTENRNVDPFFRVCYFLRKVFLLRQLCLISTDIAVV